MSELFMEARVSQRFDLSNISAVTSKSLYLSLTETMPPPSVVLKYPDRNFKLVWNRLNSGVLCKLSRNILYLVVHERSWSKEGGFRLNPANMIHHFVLNATFLCTSQLINIPLVNICHMVSELMESIEPGIIYETDYCQAHAKAQSQSWSVQSQIWPEVTPILALGTPPHRTPQKVSELSWIMSELFLWASYSSEISRSKSTWSKAHVYAVSTFWDHARFFFGPCLDHVWPTVTSRPNRALKL